MANASKSGPATAADFADRFSRIAEASKDAEAVMLDLGNLPDAAAVDRGGLEHRTQPRRSAYDRYQAHTAHP
jgi:hypothetical protein